MYERFRQGAVEVVRSDAPLHAETVDSFRSVMDQLKAGGRRNVVLDLRKVPLVDSAGLEALLDSLDEFRARGGSLKLLAPNPLVREILTVTGVEQFFEVFGDEVSAVGSFTR
jgi:anti-anti-sigma factor